MAALGAVGLGIALQSCAPAHHPLPPLAEPAPAANVDVTLFLIGDAGGPAAPPRVEPVLAALQAAVTAARSPTIVFLGDNIYPRGMPDSSSGKRAEAERRLNASLQVPRATGARGIFVLGNHDWAGDDGWAAARRAEAYIAAAPDGRSTLLPGGGCPGPAVVDLGETVRLIALDTQWWLQGGPKPRDPDSSCPSDSPAEVLHLLERAGQTAGGRVVVVVGHHPLRTGGPHGGHFGWQAHLFPLRAWKKWLWLPLPIIGSIYPIARANGISAQDTPSGTNQRMVNGLDSVLAEFRPLVYAAGHEHALQVIDGGTAARVILVSGGGEYGHTQRVTWLDSTQYARSASGFMRLEVLRDKRTRLGVTMVDETGHGTETFALWLQ